MDDGLDFQTTASKLRDWSNRRRIAEAALAMCRERIGRGAYGVRADEITPEFVSQTFLFDYVTHETMPIRPFVKVTYQLSIATPIDESMQIGEFEADFSEDGSLTSCRLEYHRSILKSIGRG